MKKPERKKVVATCKKNELALRLVHSTASYQWIIDCFTKTYNFFFITPIDPPLHT